jgi:glutathione S-transferase
VLEDWADESLYFYEMTLRFTVRHNAERFIPMLLANDPPWLRPVAERAVRPMIRMAARSQGVGRKSHEQLRTDVRRHVEAIEGLLGGGDWLLGKRLTLADIAVFAQMTCIAMTDEGQDILDDHEPVAHWLARVDETTARPG